jgi:hypothetical protein
LELNETQQFLVCADVNLLGENENIMRKNTGAVLDANKELGLDLNREN